MYKQVSRAMSVTMHHRAVIDVVCLTIDELLRELPDAEIIEIRVSTRDDGLPGTD